MCLLHGMKKFAGCILLAVNCILMAIGSAFAGPGSSTAFTYQGRLNSGAGPATGNYDFTFALFTDSSVGTQVGDTLTNTTVAVSNGLFTVNLDFGDGIFGSDPLWLQIGVRTNGGGPFALLSPLQQLTAAPNAIYSLGAGTAMFANFAATSGSASNFTGTLQSTQLNGTIPLAKLPSSIVTNGATNVVLSGAFSGDGSGLANVNSVINNTTTNPIPVSVQGEIEVQGPVRIGPLSLPIHDVDNSARQAATFSTNVFILGTNAMFNVRLTAVPADRTLVIESVSAFVDVFNGSFSGGPNMFPLPPTNQFQVILQTFSVTPWATNYPDGIVSYYTNDSPFYGFTLPAPNGYCLPALTQTIKAYAGPTTPVLLSCICSRPPTEPGVDFHVSITGHYVNTTPLIITNTVPTPSQTNSSPPDGGSGSNALSQ